MSESQTPNNESIMQSEIPKNNNKTILYVVIGVIVFCCLCCIALFIGQYILENSNFSLVNISRLLA